MKYASDSTYVLQNSSNPVVIGFMNPPPSSERGGKSKAAVECVTFSIVAGNRLAVGREWPMFVCASNVSKRMRANGPN